MAFTLKTALISVQESKEDEFCIPQENKHLFDSFMEQFNNSICKLNKEQKKYISLKYYLMNEMLLIDILEDCHIPLIDHDLSTETEYFFDDELSFYAEKGYKYKMSFENGKLFKYLIKEKKLSYYKNRETTLDDLIKKYYHNNDYFS